MNCRKHLSAIKNTLKNIRLKATPGRLELLDAFNHALRPLSAKEVGEKLKGRKVDLATIYRNLEALARKGVLKKIDFQDGQARFELAAQKHHHHIICRSCAKVEKVFDCGLEKISKRIIKSGSFAEVHGHSLEFFGLCKACRKGK